MDELSVESSPIAPNGSVEHRKQRGAYYTEASIAAFLVRWAIAGKQSVVLDPSAGEGVFLAAAARRLRDLGGYPDRQVYGVEIDDYSYHKLALQAKGHVSPANLIHANFFELDADGLPKSDAVVGNPPFIRYQRFNGAMRKTALLRAAEVGVKIPRLASAWAPFLVHAIQFIKPFGRLGMVVPAELTYAVYARPVLEYLQHSFRSMHIIKFRRRLFRELAEDTMLLLADGRGEPFESLKLD